MFGIGGSEILVILVIALLFLGPDKLPEAAKTISKTVRDLKKQGRILQQTIENDEHIGGAIRDLKSALNGVDPAPRPPPKKLVKPAETIAKPEDLAKVEAAETKETKENVEAVIAEANAEVKEPAVTLPATAGEPDAETPEHDPDRVELAKLVKPAEGAVARGEPESERKHG